MPAASCRIIPARSISRCDTISASFGFSFRMGRKNRDNRMGTLEESVERWRPAVKPDRVGKHKGARDFEGCLEPVQAAGIAAQTGQQRAFSAQPVPWSLRLRRKHVTNPLLAERPIPDC